MPPTKRIQFSPPVTQNTSMILWLIKNRYNILNIYLVIYSSDWLCLTSWQYFNQPLLSTLKMIHTGCACTAHPFTYVHTTLSTNIFVSDFIVCVCLFNWKKFPYSQPLAYVHLTLLCAHQFQNSEILIRSWI